MEKETEMWKRLFIFWIVVLLVPSVGCLEIQGTHTLYLAPDGSVVWSILEEEIRVGGTTRESRRRMESDLLDRVAGSEHEAARALEALYPGSLTARVLREQRPQSVLTEAYFPAIDDLFRNLFSLYEVPATVDLEVSDDRVRLDIRFWMNSEEDDEEETRDDPTDDDEATDLYDRFLLALLVECRIVLTEGKFVEAHGFEIVEGGRAAKTTRIDTDEAEENDTPVELLLTWTRRDEAEEAPER
jgi:hypothetical protein